MARARQIAGSLGLAAMSTAAALLLIEGLLRAFPALMPPNAIVWQAFDVREGGPTEADDPNTVLAFPQEPELGVLFRANRQMTIQHPEFDFTIDTGGLTFDEVGFRDDGVQGQPYAAAVGDSFVLGWGVQAAQSWPEQLEALLSRDVLNLGMMGSSTRKATRVLERYALPLAPEVVLYGVFLNDIDDEAQVIAYAQQGAADRVEATREELLRTQPFYRLRSWFSRSSYLYRLMAYVYYSRSDESQVCPFRQDGLHYTFEIGLWDGWLAPGDAAYEAGFDSVEHNILEAQQATQAAGAALVVVFFPAKEQVYLAEANANCGGQPDPALFEAYQARFEAFCQAEALDCLWLLEDFRAARWGAEPLYFGSDGHFSAAGNALAAQLIAEHLDGR